MTVNKVLKARLFVTILHRDPLTNRLVKGFTNVISFGEGDAKTFIGIEGSIVSLAEDSRGILGVTAHEIGHVFDLDHTKIEEWRWLMKDGGLIWRNNHLDSKRFQEGDYKIISNKKTYYVPN